MTTVALHKAELKTKEVYLNVKSRKMPKPGIDYCGDMADSFHMGVMVGPSTCIVR